MIKKSILVFAVLITWQCSAQNFPVSQNGIISYEEVVEVDSMKNGQLFSNAKKWLSSLEEEKITMTLKDSVSGHLAGTLSFFVYSQTGILKKLSGRFDYAFTIDTKDNKYRYRFTDFVFHQYQQNRNYKIVETIKTKKLEETHAAGWQKLWEKHRATVDQKMTDHLKSLQQKMKEREMVDKKIAKKQVEW